MKVLNDSLMDMISMIQQSLCSFDISSNTMAIKNIDYYGCRNECSGSCEGSCYGGCSDECFGGCAGTFGFD